MSSDFIMRVLPYILNICSGIILATATYQISKARGEKQEKDKQEKALSEGVVALLRESIVESYNKYLERGFCPIFAKESVKRAYKAYSALGGNDVATELYHKILAMPEEKEE